MGVRSFGGIAYAEPAVGDKRFRRPVPVPFAGPGKPGPLGPSLPQRPCFGAIGAVYTSRVPSVPGALTVNVHTPDPGGAGLPVLVWVHGGGFALGSGSEPLYNGGAFARDGIVEVTVNHRLGVEGFVYVEDPSHGTVANLGLHDQLAALRWVREHIEQFGGDPDRVTVAGHSAGAMSVALLMVSPPARGLFRRAIVQSPAAPLAIDAASAAGVGRYLAEVLGIPAGDVAALAAVPLPELLNGQTRLSDECFHRVDLDRFGMAGQTGMAFVPVVDGEVVAADPMAALASGAAAGTDVLAGWNRDEVMLHHDHALGGAVPDAATGAAVLGSVAAGFGPFGAEVVEAYRGLRPGLPDVRLAAAINTDAAFGQATLAVAELAAAHSTAYLYRFDQPTVIDGRDLGAIHGAELGYVFSAPDDPTARRLSGTVAPGLAAAVHQAWAAFVADGHPQADGLPPWPEYDPVRRRTMVLAAPGSDVVEDPLAIEQALWSTVAAGLTTG